MAEWPNDPVAQSWPNDPVAQGGWPDDPVAPGSIAARQGVTPTTPPSDSPGSFMRGLVTSVTQGNPDSFAEYLEGWSHSAPEFIQGPMRNASQKVRDWAKSIKPEGYETLTKSMYDIDSLQHGLDWGFETVGSGIGSSLPTIAVGGAGAATGAAVGGPIGAVAGGVAGAAQTSYMQNYGEVYKALKDEKIDPKVAHEYARAWAIPIAGLDVASLGTIVSRFGGTAAAKRELTKGLARKIAREIGTGAATEASTEALQELGKEMAIAHAQQGEVSLPREGTGWKMLEAGVAGGLTGGAMAGPAALRRGEKPEGEPTYPMPEEPVVTPPPRPMLALPPPDAITSPSPNDMGPPPVVTAPATTAPAVTEDYEVRIPQPNNPAVVSVMPIRVTRGADGGMDTFDSPGMPTYKVPPEYRFAPTDMTLAIKYGGREGVDRRNVVRTDVPLTGAPDPNALPSATPAQELHADGVLSLLGGSEFTVSDKPKSIEELRGKAARIEQSPQAQDIAGLMALSETRKGRPGVDPTRLAMLLGPKLYSDQTATTIKELFQNAFDAIKGTFGRGQPGGSITINTDPNARVIELSDDGTGMTPEVLGNQFLTIAGTKKESNRASGGLGIAKMVFLFGSENLHVTTMRNGVVSEMRTTGPSLFNSMSNPDDPSLAPDITTRKPTREDLQRFPKGHGTHIRVQIPQSYTNPSTGQQESIWFPNEYSAMPYALDRSLLLEDVNVTINGRQLPIGRNFPTDQYNRLPDAKFDWGSARIYTSAAMTKKDSWEDNVHILSNGIWQFSTMVAAGQDRLIQRDIYIDVNPQVRPEDAGYPFDLNRQRFSPAVEKDFGKIFKFMSIAYMQFEYSTAVENFGDMQYVDFEGGRITNTGPFELKPPPPTEGPLGAANIFKEKGNKFEVRKGELIVDGKTVPELSTDDFDRVETVDISSLRIPQEEIFANRVILHDNISMSPTGAPLTDTSPRVSMTEYAYAKYGQRFYDYVFLMGEAFMELRDIVSKFEDPNLGQNYSGLMNEGIGISFDPNYRGVSIRVPFSASFLNIAAPVYADPIRAALGMIGTMIHELAHHIHRSENMLEPVTSNINILLNAHPTFDMRKFKQRVIDIVNQYQDIMVDLKGVHEDGYSEPRGRRFEVGDYERRSGGRVGDVANAAAGAKSFGSEIRDWVAVGETGVGRSAGRSDGGVKTTGARDASFGLNANVNALRAEAGHRDVFGVTAQQETAPLYSAIKRAMNNNVPPAVKAMKAHADTMNWFYKYMAGLLELGRANPKFGPLLRYIETVMGMHREEARFQDAAMRITKDWRRLGKQSENLTALIDDVTNMVYLKPNEAARHPFPPEFAALVKKHKVSARALEVYHKVVKFMSVYLDLVTQNAQADAMRLIKDPVKLSAELNKINATRLSLQSRPYFPFMRFGSHFVTLYDAQNKVVSFEVFERKQATSAEKQQQARVKELKKHYPADRIKWGVLPPDVAQIYGLPSTLLEHMAQRMTLSQAQRDALQQLQFEMSPSMSFRHRFQHKNYIEGYSHDFLRAFSHYAFHGAKYYARTKYGWQAEQYIKEAEAVPNQNKAARIAHYMRDHWNNTIINAKGDWGQLKGAIFFWAMGYSVAAATTNMTQTPMVTLPYLAAKFGDHKAVAAIVDAMTHLNSFYRKGSYPDSKDMTAAFAMRALSYGIKTGRISETQAAELAALAQGGNLLYGSARTPVRRAFIQLMEKAPLFFETAEQFNRRVAYRAALQLAMFDNNNKFVNEIVARNPVEYDTLVNVEKFSPQEARAILTANHATEESQFVYARYARPRFMRSPFWGTVFVFKRYIQSYVMLAWGNKRDIGLRMMLVMMAMGGLFGIPGSDDILGLAEAGLKLLGYWKKDPRYNVDIKTEIRRYILQFTDGQVPPDMVLHGLARRGFGVPTILDMAGSYATGRPGRGLLSPTPASNIPFPYLDRSKSISSGPLLPVEIGKLLFTEGKTEKAIADQTQRASGAVFSVGFNLYKAALGSEQEIGDWKRWEVAMPRAFGGVSKAFRTYTEERSRGSRGGPAGAATRLDYDVRDPEQLSEIIAQGMGYNTLRESQKIDTILAQQEHKQYIVGMQKMLYQQFHEAISGQYQQEIDEVMDSIRKFNILVSGTPDALYSITRDSLKQSFETRERSRILQSQGLPTQKRDIPIYQDIQRLFPESVIDVKRR